MFNVSANCSPIRPAFGKRDSHRNIDGEKLNEVNNALRSIKDDSLSDEDKAKNFNDLNAKLTDGMRPSSPLKVVIGAVCIGLAGFFLGRKIVGQKALDVIDKNTKTIDFISKKTESFMDKLHSMKPTDEKTFKGFVSRTADKLYKKLDTLGKNSIDEETLAKIKDNQPEIKKLTAKNIARSAITNIGGGIGMGVGVKEATDDKNGDMTPDIFQYKKPSGATSLGTVSTIVDTMDIISDLI